MPELLVEARRVAHTVTHGIHGRRRAGPGETFWQFRHFEVSDTAGAVDWRRSASSDHLYVREREWEAAHTVWLWVDLSPSMAFHSHLAERMKAERVIVLALAIAELLSRGGERIGLIGRRAWAGRVAVRNIAAALAQDIASGEPQPSLPPVGPLTRFSGCLLLSDFLEPVDEIAPRLEALGAAGIGGHLAQVLDPAEETLPYEGRTEFTSSEGGERMIAGRAESLRQQYQARVAAHRERLKRVAARLGWSFLLHHTDRPGEEALLALHTRLAGLERDYRHRPASGTAAAEALAS
jgi:uncharacterized protein (DUF58 family)